MQEAAAGAERSIDAQVAADALAKRVSELEALLAEKERGLADANMALKKRIEELEKALAEARKPKPAPPIVKKGMCGC